MSTECGDDGEVLPGHELVDKGLADLAAGRETVESLLVQIGRPRLERLGFEVRKGERPEMRLYEVLYDEHRDGAHSKYNALIRRLVSFERAAEFAARRP